MNLAVACAKLGRKVMTTGGGAKIRGYLQAKKRWTGDFEYEYQDQSSLLGAAMLGQFSGVALQTAVAASSAAR